MVKKTILILLNLLCITSLNAQSDNEYFIAGQEQLKSGNHQEAFALFKKGAASNDGASALIVGYYFEKIGLAVDKNIDSALFWYEKATNIEFDEAFIKLGTLYQTEPSIHNIEKAIYWYQKAADKKIVDGFYNLGSLYLNGDEVPQDYKKAAYYFEEAAKMDDVEAMSFLGQIYHNGDATLPANLEMSFKWYLKAAENGNVYAMGKIGVMYHLGEGTKKDDKKAKEWLLKASDCGDEDAYFYYSKEVKNK